MKNTQQKGKVILAGAGPGDPELLTIKALRYLQQADIILADRLVSEELLARYVPAGTEIIYVGKQNNAKESVPQTHINQLLIKYAGFQGKLVVRLKGGDVSVFSNIFDELKVLNENGILYEVIPGITAASGAAAYSGIPLTARGYSTAIRFLTFYQTGLIKQDYWKELAQTDDTLVFYMSAETLDEAVTNLLRHHIAEDKLMAVVEQATTPLQQVRVCNLYEYDVKMKGEIFLSPVLIIIGRVVVLHKQFAWLTNNDSGEYYFKPINQSI